MKRFTTIISILVMAATSFAQNHFNVAWSGFGNEHMNFYVVTATIGGVDLEAGDEIAVFDGSICCGAAVLTSAIDVSDINTFAAIVASKIDEGKLNGYTTGNAITYKIWDASKNMEISGITAEYFKNNGQATTEPAYTPNVTALVKLSVATPANQAPVANAGTDQTVDEGALVTLDGSASSDADSNPLTYKWTAPAGISLSSDTDQKPTFTAPEVTADTDYTFSLVVNDGTVDSSADEVKITVKQVNKAPVANAGSDQSVNEGATVSLDGSASSDADSDPLTYKWTAPAGITLSSDTDQKPTFTAPEVTTDTEYTFSLVVNDGTADSPADEVIITVKQVNKIPEANAGNDQVVNKNETVTLDGSASSDADNDPLTYQWTAPAGITLSSVTAEKPTFTAPDVLVNTDYTFSLIVNDGTADSPADEVKITVKFVNQAPTANAGDDQTVNEGVEVTLNGSASTDPDGNTLSYKWTAPATITLSSTSAEKPTFTAPEVTADTEYTFSLVVNDGTADSPADQVKITVKQVNKVPVANAGNDQTVNEGATVSLDGSASSDADSDALTYKWTAPAGISLSSDTDQKPTFTAPEVSADTEYIFSLVVNDGTSDSPADQVKITVKQINKVPVAIAGNDRTVLKGTTVILDGSGSSDPDGDVLSYKWTAPAGITLSSNTAEKPTFTAPDVLTNTDYTFSLIVNDGTADSPADEVKITVKSGNQAPTANAGNDQTVNEGDEVTLDGSASSDPDGNALTYKWTGPAGITLSSNTAEKPTFTAPDVASNTSFTFSLVVNDGIADSPADDVVITVKQVGQAPTANAGPDQTVNEGDLVTLDASGSSNPENKATAIEWSAPGTIQLNDPILIKVVVTGPSYTSTSSHDYSLMLYDASPGATPGNHSFLFEWTVPSGVSFSTSTTSLITILPPNPPAKTSYSFSLEVFDSSGPADPGHNGMTYFTIPSTDFEMDPITVIKMLITGTEPTMLSNQTFSLEVSDASNAPAPGPILMSKTWTMPAGITFGTTAVSLLEIISPEVPTNPDYKFKLEFNDGFYTTDARHNGLTYHWTASGGIILSSDSDPYPTFIAPEVTTDTDYTFTLVVNNGFADSPPDQMKVTVKQVNKAPQANSGTDHSANEGATVTLDGSASSDPDGDVLTYKWTSVPGITLSSETDAKPTFTAPEVSADTQYTFSLVVSDGLADSPADEVLITVLQVNKIPQANAGADHSANEGATVSLNGSASSDPDGDALTYKWTSVPGITLSSETDANPTFTAPEVSADTQYTFSLVVSDGSADSPADEVVITVLQVNKIPQANAGADQSANESATVTLDGSASSDPDGDVLTYKWTSVPGITLSSETDANPTFTAPEVSADTQYTFSLVVSDGSSDSPADEVVITVLQVNKIPQANAGNNQSVDEGATVTLNGSTSTDPDGDALTYKWTAPSGIILSSETAEKPTFTAPEVSADTEYTFLLIVNDGFAESLPDDVVIKVLNVDHAPYVKNPIQDISVDKRAPDQILDLKTVFADDDFGDVLTFSVSSNTNTAVVLANISGSDLTLSFSTENIGLAEVEITASSNGKEVKSKFKVEVNIPTGIFPERESAEIIIYPNPTKGEVQVKFNQIPKSETWISVYSASGILIHKSQAKDRMEKLNLAGQSVGMYFIKIDQETSKSYRLILQ